jgi:hypothetical protein
MLTIDEIKERSPTGISGPKKIIARPRAKSVISTYECSQFRTGFAADSPLEGDGFELPVPELVGRCGFEAGRVADGAGHT